MVSETFLRVLEGLPRAGPGHRESTARAVAALDLPAAPRVLDIACGPGAQTRHLAELLPKAKIVAIDIFPQFVEAARAATQAYSERVLVQQADMNALPFASKSQDLLWCEGAIYIPGVSVALDLWRDLIAEGGCLAFTECVWLKDEVDATLKSWWQAEYPGMTDVSGVLAQIEGGGYECLDWFVLPEAAWWEYYGPMRDRIAAVRGEADDAELEAIDEEIRVYEQFHESYGYAFFLTRPIPR